MKRQVCTADTYEIHVTRSRMRWSATVFYRGGQDSPPLQEVASVRSFCPGMAEAQARDLVVSLERDGAYTQDGRWQANRGPITITTVRDGRRSIEVVEEGQR